MKLRHAVRKQSGFTLTEVLVSVGIVATLAAAVSPTVFQHIKESRIAKAKSDAQSIASAVQRFRADMEVWPAQASGAVLNNVHGLLFSEAGRWPRIDLASEVSCDTGEFGTPTGVYDLDTIDGCDGRWGGNFVSWVPANTDVLAVDDDDDPIPGQYAGVLDPNITGNCDATSEGDLRARIPEGSEFHSPASLDAFLIHNMPPLARLDADGDPLYDFTTVGDSDYLSMIDPDNCAGVLAAVTVNQDAAYQYKTDPGQAGWNGPYLASIPSDPWGNKYLVNIHFGFAGSDHGFNPEAHENNTIMVLSAGPNGMIETPVGYHGDEDGDISFATGVNVQAGGDDVVYVFNLSKRSTM